MNNYRLTSEARKKLWKAHRRERNKQKADRLKAVYLLGKDWPVEKIAEALLLSENSIRNYFEAYREGGIEKLVFLDYKNNSSYLDPEQLQELSSHLEELVYLRAEDIIAYVKKVYGVDYSVNGMTDLLHRIGFVYKKPKLKPAKADREQQMKFIRKYRKIQKACGKEDRIYFMDATHPHYQTVTGYGWVKKGSERRLSCTLSQSPLNINGAIDIQKLSGVFKFEKTTLKQEHTADMLVELRKRHPKGRIYLITDRGGCYSSKAIKQFAKGLGIKTLYLPPYSPNLNVIERLWLFFKKKVLYNRTYANFEEFCEACKKFFKELPCYKTELRTLLTDNFQLF